MNSSFIEINPSEIPDILEVICKNRDEITFWEKGSSKTQNKCVAYKHIGQAQMIVILKDKLSIVHENGEPTSNKGQDVLFQFTYQYVNYFGQGIIKPSKHLQNKDFFLEITGKLFKNEKRSNFRLKFNSKEGCFKVGHDIFELFDVSVGGLCLIVPSDKVNYFNNKDKIKDNGVLEILEENFIIPHFKVTHIKESPDEANTYLIGIRFHNLPEKEEAKIFRALNNKIMTDLYRQ